MNYLSKDIILFLVNEFYECWPGLLVEALYYDETVVQGDKLIISIVVPFYTIDQSLVYAHYSRYTRRFTRLRGNYNNIPYQINL